ncbi:MAG: hypothetical protein IAI49_12845 [Candidatus Eremiobacteraeota bacterium]|nr:hypothetical protein [Candidatus Eremiobacteraeota bacterium]
MRNFARSEGYAKARLVTGTLFALLGATLVVRTLLLVGADAKAIPALVLGGAMIALGVLRFRDYRAARRSRP